MVRVLWAVAAVLCVGGWGLAADEKKPADKPADKPDGKGDVPTGVWLKKTDEGLSIQLDFTTKDTLVVTNGIEDKRLIITCKVTADKDGKLTAKATKVENKGDFPVTVSDKFEFSFKAKVGKDKVTLSDFKANEHEDQAKSAVEGEYKRVESK